MEQMGIHGLTTVSAAIMRRPARRLVWANPSPLGVLRGTDPTFA